MLLAHRAANAVDDSSPAQDTNDVSGVSALCNWAASSRATGSWSAAPDFTLRDLLHWCKACAALLQRGVDQRGAVLLGFEQVYGRSLARTLGEALDGALNDAAASAPASASVVAQSLPLQRLTAAARLVEQQATEHPDGVRASLALASGTLLPQRQVAPSPMRLLVELQAVLSERGVPSLSPTPSQSPILGWMAACSAASKSVAEARRQLDDVARAVSESAGAVEDAAAAADVASAEGHAWRARGRFCAQASFLVHAASVADSPWLHRALLTVAASDENPHSGDDAAEDAV